MMSKFGLKKVILILAVLGAAGVLGIWFLISPTAEIQDNLDKQTELINSIEAESGTIIIDEEAENYVIDFYDEHATEISSETDEPSEIPEEMTAPQAPNPVTEISGIGILAIDKIDLKMPVVEGVSETLLKVAVCHVSETASIGETGNAVLAGHRGYTYGDYLNRLGEMEIGDVIRYTPIGGDMMTFEVFEITEILPDDQAAFIQPDDETIITLYTCTPIQKATHRLLVKAVKI